MDTFCQYFLDHIPEVKTLIRSAFEMFTDQGPSIASDSDITRPSYKIIWEFFEDTVCDQLTAFLLNSPLGLDPTNITRPSSKEEYPDLKVNFRGNDYAIDVKSAGKRPAFDMGRLDTYEEDHRNFICEFTITIRWHGRDNPQFADVYIEPTFKSVGKSRRDGVAYREKEGNIRPKSWGDFVSGKSHWDDMEHFMRGLSLSRRYRHRILIRKWYTNMNHTDRASIRKDLGQIDANLALDPLDLIDAD